MSEYTALQQEDIMPNYAAKVDANHREIVQALEACGYVVCDTHRAGFGAPDLFVLSKSKLWVGIEIKSSTGGLTQKEAELFEKCGSGAPLYTVMCVEAALDLMGHFDEVQMVHIG